MIKSWFKTPSGEMFSAFVASMIIKIILTSTRTKMIDHGGYAYAQQGKPFILAIWHGRLLGLPLILKEVRVWGMTSKSRDGRIIAKVGDAFGINSIWGSSSANALSGYRGMKRILTEGSNIVITPDGPRGPSRKAAPGAVGLARACGVPIIPVSWSSARMHKWNSWDNFACPLPFSKSVQYWGEPIMIPKDADSTMVEDYCRKLEDAINHLTAEADKQFGHIPDDAEHRYGIRKGKR